MSRREKNFLAVPARPHKEMMKIEALLNRLPEMYETLRR